MQYICVSPVFRISEPALVFIPPPLVSLLRMRRSLSWRINFECNTYDSWKTQLGVLVVEVSECVDGPCLWRAGACWLKCLLYKLSTTLKNQAENNPYNGYFLGQFWHILSRLTHIRHFKQVTCFSCVKLWDLLWVDQCCIDLQHISLWCNWDKSG